MKWKRPHNHAPEWSMCRFGMFGIFVCFFDGWTEAGVQIYRHSKSPDHDWYNGPGVSFPAKSKAQARSKAVSWARKIGLAVPR